MGEYRLLRRATVGERLLVFRVGNPRGDHALQVIDGDVCADRALREHLRSRCQPSLGSLLIWRSSNADAAIASRPRPTEGTKRIRSPSLVSPLIHTPPPAEVSGPARLRNALGGEDGGGEDYDLLSVDRRVGASQNSLPRFHQRDPAVALPNFDITTMRKICHLLFCIIVVHAA